jgi:hypothetical protein
MHDYGIRDSLNRKDRNSYRIITSNELLKWSGINGRYIKVKKAANDESLSDEVRSASFAAIVMVDRDNTVFDYNDSVTQGIVEILVTNDIISQSDKDELMSSLSFYISRGEELGISRVRKRDIERAKNVSQ